MSRHLMRLLAAHVLPRPMLTWVKTQYYVRSVEKFWEQDVEPIKALVKSGDFVIDMGANFGWYTNILSSMVGDTGRVYSVEPIPDTFKVFSGIVRKLGLRNVERFNVAMSVVDGSTVMRVPQHEYGGNNFYRAQIDQKPGDASSPVREYTVAMRSLDSLFLSVAENVTFIKCDVEGHELSVVKGGAKFFEKSRPAWLMEVGGNPDEEGTSPYELFNIMRGYGYEVYFFDGKVLRRRPIGHWTVNYLLLQPMHCQQLSYMIAKN